LHSSSDVQEAVSGTMGMQHGHASGLCSMDIQHVDMQHAHEAWTYNKDKQYGDAARSCSMYMNMYVHVHYINIHVHVHVKHIHIFLGEIDQ
jgi:hypothetical protein